MYYKYQNILINIDDIEWVLSMEIINEPKNMTKIWDK